MKRIRFLILLFSFFLISESMAQDCSCNEGGCEITASIPFNGGYAEGNYVILLANGHEDLVNPIVIVEGLDFDNVIDCSSYLNNLGPSLNTLGYDLVYLNFSKPLDGIEGNAMLLVELINKIQQNYTENELVIFGLNTGAIVSRYALVYMEENNMNHNTKLYVSYDGPHQGFNFPIGLNALNEKLSIFNPVSVILKTKLEQPLFQQLLMYNSQFPPESSSFESEDFFNNLKEMNDCNGYPKKCRKIAISGGAGDGQTQNDVHGNPVFEGDLLFLYSSQQAAMSGGCSSVRSTSLPSPGYYTLYNSISFFGNHSFQLTNQQISNLKPLDSCPGSYSNFVLIARNLISTLSSDVVIVENFDNVTFVPTLSALDIKSDDIAYDLTTISNLSDYTSFDEVKYQSFNYPSNSINPLLGSLNFIQSNISITSGDAVCDDDFNLFSNVSSSGVTNYTKVFTQVNAEIEGGTVSEFYSEGYVDLLPGFHAKVNSDVTVAIESCDFQICDPPFLPKRENGQELVKESGYNIDLDTNLGVKLYPNPVKDILKVESLIVISQIEVFSLIGERVAVFKNMEDNEVSIDLSGLKQGSYIIQIRTGLNNSKFKIFKE